MKLMILFILGPCMFLSGFVRAAEEQDPVVDMSEPERCLSLRSIKQIKIIDERNILFIARRNKIYQNTLPRKCIGLKPDAIINYEVVMSRLCQKDLITVHDRYDDLFIGGASCGLGMFQQIPNLEQLGLED